MSLGRGNMLERAILGNRVQISKRFVINMILFITTFAFHGVQI